MVLDTTHASQIFSYMHSPKHRMAFLCFATLGSVLSRTTLPGGYSVGQELHYIGSLRYTDAASAISSMSGITMKPPLTMGMKGIVVGPPGEPSLVGSALSLKFAMLFDEVVDVPLQDLSLEPPPPPDLEKLKFYGILFISLFVGLLGAFWIWILYFDEPPAEAAKEPPAVELIKSTDEVIAGGAEGMRQRSTARPASADPS